MRKGTAIILLLSVLLLTGCIESGGLDIPRDSGVIDLSRIRSQIKKVADNDVPPSKMGVPLGDLPSYIQRNQEHGFYQEAYSLKDLPSTVIYWEVRKDPYSRVLEDQRKDSVKGETLILEGGNVTPWIFEDEDLYRVSAHEGLYTFSAWTGNPADIDKLNIYGSHEEIVDAIFRAGMENALKDDLTSFGK